MESNATLLYDGIFSWEGFGGLYHLAAGRCRLRIFDLSKSPHSNVALMKPVVIVVSDLPDDSPKIKKVSVRSCTSHIVTKVTERFKIDYQRMVYVEYSAQSAYGPQNQHLIPAKFEAVDFVWHDGKALHPKWRSLDPTLRNTIAPLIDQTDQIKTVGDDPPG
jgi:hypothetical protein